jgi:putative FmdB family regulatory protein
MLRFLRTSRLVFGRDLGFGNHFSKMDKGNKIMPIYEFRCLKCNDCFEFLLRNQEEQIELRCPKCKSEEFERVHGRRIPQRSSCPGENPKLFKWKLHDLRHPRT